MDSSGFPEWRIFRSNLGVIKRLSPSGVRQTEFVFAIHGSPPNAGVKLNVVRLIVIIFILFHCFCVFVSAEVTPFSTGLAGMLAGGALKIDFCSSVVSTPVEAPAGGSKVPFSFGMI